MIRSFVKSVVRATVRQNWLWRAFESTLGKTVDYARWERTRVHDPEAEELAAFNREFANQISPELKVKHGPFKGMQYLEHGFTCGPLLPRLLGSYERELHNVIEACCHEPYTEIVDIGCAEGFYAVGMAIRLPDVHVYAYDISERAQTKCKEMAIANDVNERITIRGECSPETLIDFEFTGKGFVVCDCEGYEGELFTPEVAGSLSHCDVLVELHDIYDISISSKVLSSFSKTHSVKLIHSVDDTEKAKTYEFPEIVAFDLATRKRLVSEHRAGIMQWAFFQPLIQS